MSTNYEAINTAWLDVQVMRESELDAEGYEGDDEILVLSYDEVVTIHGDLPKFGRMVADAVGVKHAGRPDVQQAIRSLEAALDDREKQAQSDDDVPMDDLFDAVYAVEDAAMRLIAVLS